MAELSDSGFLSIGAQRLEYRMIGPRPDNAPTIVMLHEGLGCVGLWGDFPDRLQKATGCSVEKGFAIVPDLPGLGVELNEDVVKAHLAPNASYFAPTPEWDSFRSNDRLWS